MRFFAALFFLIFFGTFSTAIAQTDTDEFYVRVFAGTDTEPPTTPTLTSATAASPTQIDLVWSASTDNFVLSGYIIDRSIGSSSTSTIATTTLTSFSDTGLSASTTYNYSVRAFDSIGNYSTSSNMLSETTPNFPVVATSTSSSTEQTVARVVAKEVIVTPHINYVDFDITSPFPARFEIRWGRTASYELGFVASDILRKNYSTIINGLEPGTRYEYEIIGFTPSGKSNVVDRGQFRTLDDFDLTAPANVKRFQAIPLGGDVNLSWELPEDDDISFVRIVRSHLGYPTTPSDGAIIYQGLGVKTSDLGVLFQYSPAYYTAFVYDSAGNISSGAITIAFFGTDSARNSSDVEGGDSVFVIPLEPLSSTTQKMPDAFEIIIKQANLEYSFGQGRAILDSDQPFLIYIDADDVTSNLKSIIVQLQDPTDQRKTFAFLLRLNKDQTAYEAVVAPLGVVGKSSIVLSVYDFRALRVAEYRTQLFFEEIGDQSYSDDASEGDTRLLWMFLLAILLLLLLVIWWLIAKDRDEDEDKEDAEESSKRYSTDS